MSRGIFVICTSIVPYFQEFLFNAIKLRFLAFPILNHVLKLLVSIQSTLDYRIVFGFLLQFLSQKVAVVTQFYNFSEFFFCVNTRR